MGWATSTLSAYAAWFGASLALECTPSAIQSILPSNASVNFAYLVPANSTFQVPKGDTGYPDSPVGLPSLCAASVQVKSIGNSTFGFGLFLPEAWNNRFLAVGNGGFAGGINWLDMVNKNPSKRFIRGEATLTGDDRQQGPAMDLQPCRLTLATILPLGMVHGHTTDQKR